MMMRRTRMMTRAQRDALLLLNTGPRATDRATRQGRVHGMTMRGLVGLGWAEPVPNNTVLYRITAKGRARLADAEAGRTEVTK